MRRLRDSVAEYEARLEDASRYGWERLIGKRVVISKLEDRLVNVRQGADMACDNISSMSDKSGRGTLPALPITLVGWLYSSSPSLAISYIFFARAINLSPLIRSWRSVESMSGFLWPPLLLSVS